MYVCRYMCTWEEVAELGEELNAASVAVNGAFDDEGVMGIGGVEEREEAEDKGKDDCGVGHFVN